LSAIWIKPDHPRFAEFLAFGVAGGSFIYPFPKLRDSFIFLFLGEAALGHVMRKRANRFFAAASGLETLL
jgi:hypothetical protein